MSTYVLVPEILLRDALDLVDRDRVDGVLNLLRGHAAAAGDELAANVLRDRGGAVETEQETRLELALCALDLHLRRRHRGCVQGAEGQPDLR